MVNEAKILEAIYWRKYDRLDFLVNREINEWGFGSFRKIVLKKSEQVPRPRVRDAIFHLMGLDAANGLDIDPIQLLEDRTIDADTLSDLKITAHEFAVSTLEDMIETKNTFFLDTEKMATSEFAVFVSDILEVRKKEILALESPASIWDVIQTAYGYSIFVTGGYLTLSGSKAHQKLGKALANTSQLLGTELEIKSTPLYLGSTISGFENCREETKKLLWHLLRFKTYKGKNLVRDSAKYLEKHADSRIAPLLHNYLERGNLLYDIVGRIIRRLGEVGLTESFHYLLPILEKHRRGNWFSTTLNSIVKIPGQVVTDYIVERYVYNGNHNFISILFKRPGCELAPHMDAIRKKLYYLKDQVPLRQLENMVQEDTR